MPCYTLVQVTVKDRAIADKALKKLGVEADITQNSDKTYSVTPQSTSYSFKENFLQAYAMEKAKVEARKAGYTVTEKGDTLILRQY